MSLDTLGYPKTSYIDSLDTHTPMITDATDFDDNFLTLYRDIPLPPKIVQRHPWLKNYHHINCLNDNINCKTLGAQRNQEMAHMLYEYLIDPEKYPEVEFLLWLVNQSPELVTNGHDLKFLMGSSMAQARLMYLFSHEFNNVLEQSLNTSLNIVTIWQPQTWEEVQDFDLYGIDFLVVFKDGQKTPVLVTIDTKIFHPSTANYYTSTLHFVENRSNPQLSDEEAVNSVNFPIRDVNVFDWAKKHGFENPVVIDIVAKIPDIYFSDSGTIEIPQGAIRNFSRKLKRLIVSLLKARTI